MSENDTIKPSTEPDTTYNGWSGGWETWNYNLLFCDDDSIFEMGICHGEDFEFYGKPLAVYDLAQRLEEDCEMYFDEIEENIFSSFTQSALGEVSFFEIAENHYEEYMEGYAEGVREHINLPIEEKTVSVIEHIVEHPDGKSDPFVLSPETSAGLDPYKPEDVRLEGEELEKYLAWRSNGGEE